MNDARRIATAGILSLGLLGSLTPGCGNEPLTCSAARPCNDDDPCTADTCVNDTCEFTPLTTPTCTETCASDGECIEDYGPCNDAACIAGTCVAVPIVDCCLADADCAPTGVSCQEAFCDEGTCASRPIPECSGCGGTCDDGRGCTTDACEGTTCTHTAIAGCQDCDSASMCTDTNDCTTDACIAHVCTNTPIPGCGTTTGATACSAFPATIDDVSDAPPGAYDVGAYMCVEPCSAMADAVFPVPPGECAPVLSFGMTESDELFAGVLDTTGYGLLAADAPVQRNFARIVVTDGAPTHLSVFRRSDGARFDVAFVSHDGSVDFTSAGPGTGPLPYFGGAFPCGEPHVFTTGVDDGTGLQRFAQVCDESSGSYGICTLHGDIDATPEDETCASYALSLGYVSGSTYAQRGLGWSIVSSTHGDGTGSSRTNMPLDTDVTIVVTHGSGNVSIVARWTGTAVEIRSVTHL